MGQLDKPLGYLILESGCAIRTHAAVNHSEYYQALLAPPRLPARERQFDHRQTQVGLVDCRFHSRVAEPSILISEHLRP